MPSFSFAARTISVALIVPSLTVALSTLCGCKKSPGTQATNHFTAQSKGIDPTLLAKAEAGDAIEQRKLGYAFDLGQGAPQDYIQASIWYRKAADQGDAKAQYDLGLLYKQGHGVAQDYEQASAWFRKAADQGNSRAEFYLGLLYDSGLGVSHDYSQAASWYRKAADQGDVNAQLNLGSFYDKGKGVPQDRAQALFWLGKAAGQGDQAAITYLEAMQQPQEAAKTIPPSNQILSYWPTTLRVDTDMDSFWLPDEERTCKTYPNDKGTVAIVACNATGLHRDHNIPVKFWGDPDRNTVSEWKCRREGDSFVCRAIN